MMPLSESAAQPRSPNIFADHAVGHVTPRDMLARYTADTAADLAVDEFQSKIFPPLS
jgi:hypothetical protein